MTAYTIHAKDSETTPRWMSLCTGVRPGLQDSGRCLYHVETAQPAELEAALEADDSVLRYECAESYRIRHSHGQVETAESYEDAVARVRAVYGDDCAIGHDGDIAEGGTRTLCWPDEETAQDDDGLRACCSIVRVR